jgi:hypothetical protein
LGIPFAGFQGAYLNNQPVITLIFTNSEASGIPIVISAIEQAIASGALKPEDIPIVVIYFEKQPNGSYLVRATCIGRICSQLEQAGVIERIRQTLTEPFK